MPHRISAPDYRAQVSEMAPEEAVEYLLVLLETATFVRPSPKWESVMPLFPARLVTMLEQAAPRAVAYGVLYDAMTWSLADNELPQPCTIRTWAKRARKKLPPGYQIKAVRGFGLRLQTPA